MSFSAYRTLLPPTGLDYCTTAFLTHCPGDRRAVAEPTAAQQTEVAPPIGTWAAASGEDGAGRLLPNLVVVKANMLEVYVVRAASNGKAGPEQAAGERAQGAWLELAFESRLHGTVVSVAVLKSRQDDLTGRRTQHDALVLGFKDAQLSVVEWDDDEQTLQTSSLHSFESATWQHLKRGLEKFPRGPVIRSDPQGRCAVALLYDDQLLVMKTKASGLGFGEEETVAAGGGAASIDSTYFLDLRTVGVKNVKDLVFLHGYLEPALLVLHEPDPTWGGRASVRRFSCEATVLSLNTTLRQHPTIFAAQSLPYDAYQAVAVAAPLGGALIVAANTVHYFSQTAFQTLALNSVAAVPEGMTPPPYSSVEVELDVARICWLAHDTALVSAKTGMLLTLTLGHDGRAVHSLALSPSKGAVLASSVCTVGDSLFFLGSRLGDSLLVRYSRGSPQEDKAGESELEDVSRGEPPAKRARYADVTVPAADISEEVSLYGRSILDPEDAELEKIFNFSICDTMLNLGPVRDLVIGRRTKTDPDDEEKGPVTETELVLCSGHAKNGALSILHQGIRPAITTEVDLGSACRGIWAVHHQTDGSDSPEGFHSYVVISLEDGTRVLSTGESIAELDDESGGFFTSGPTLAVGNLFGRERILQVHAEGFHLLEGADLQQEVPLFEFPTLQQPEAELRIAAAAICDPFALFQLTDGSLRIGESDSAEKEVLVGTVSLAGDVADVATAVTLFEDRQGSFSGRKDGGQNVGESPERSAVCAAVARRSGAVEIYTLPGFEVVYRITNFCQGSRILVSNTLPARSPSSSPAAVEVSSLVVRCPSTTAERDPSQPYIAAVLSSGTALAYRGFSSGQHVHQAKPAPAQTPLQERTANGADNESAHAALDTGKPAEARQSAPWLRWVRVSLDGVNGFDDGSSEEAAVAASLTPFEGVNGRRGMYLSAARPAWIMECGGRLRPHVQLQDGAVAAFSSFHNVHNPHGCVYVTAAGILRIAQLPTEFDYDAGWPVAKVPLRATPHQVAHFADADVYVVAVSVPVDRPFSRPPGTPPREDAAAEDGETAEARSRSGDAGAVFCDLENFELRMLASGTWDTLTRVPMLRYEHIAAATAVALKNITNEQRDVFLAVGTVSVFGEDAPSHGRVLLYRVEKGEEGNALASVFSEEHRAGVTSVAAVQGCLVAAIGAKVILYRWDGTGLVTAAFFDAPMYVTSLTSLKSYVLVGDFERSVHFLHWVDTPTVAQLRELAKDYTRASTATTAFMNDGKALALVAADYDRNMRVFEYSPTNGQLACRAEFHVGSLVAKILRVDVALSARGPRRPRSACLFGTLDGALAALTPLDEMTFKRLQALHRRMSDTCHHVAGLNPRASRKVQGASLSRGPIPENVTDLDLVAEYEMLAYDEQTLLARQIGTSREKLLADIGDFWRGLTIIL